MANDKTMESDDQPQGASLGCFAVERKPDARAFSTLRFGVSRISRNALASSFKPWASAQRLMWRTRSSRIEDALARSG